VICADCIALRNAAHARVTAPPKVDDFVGIAHADKGGERGEAKKKEQKKKHLISARYSSSRSKFRRSGGRAGGGEGEKRERKKKNIALPRVTALRNAVQLHAPINDNIV